MENRGYLFLKVFVLFVVLTFPYNNVRAQTIQNVQINTGEVHQTITGFGASLAFYEGWLTAHPNKAEIYDVIFKELSLDILRVRNTYGYEDGMITRVNEFVQAAQTSLGHPIDLLVTSWGPPAYLKSNNDKNNGGTLKYTVSGGKVNFNYSGFADWWNASLDNYKLYGIYPKYISIQNEPDWKASYESCLLRPSEVVTSTDTFAGYNKALDAVYDVVTKRQNPPLFLGPENVGIGYNNVENYINALDITKLHGFGHHLYHGAEGGTVQNDPFTSTNYRKVGEFYPEIPHFQTEYSRADWYSVAAMMYMSLVEENVAAFLYWDLIWSDAGLVSLDFPWDRNRWTNTSGYTRTKDFYAFKHYSAFIHPGWKRIGTTTLNETVKTAAFISPGADSATFVVMNRSLSQPYKIRVQVPGYVIQEATAYSTTSGSNFASANYLTDSVLNVPPRSVNTLSLRLMSVATNAEENQVIKDNYNVSNSPNPFSVSTTIRFETPESADFFLEVYDISGKKAVTRKIGFYEAGSQSYTFQRQNMDSGIYFYHIKSSSGKIASGRFVIAD